MSYAKILRNYTAFFVFSNALIALPMKAQIEKYTVPVTYSYPTPYSSEVSQKTTLGIRYAEQIDKISLGSSMISVTGSVSGKHSGKISLALDGRTVLFAPDKYFIGGEKVQVSLNSFKCTSGRTTATYSFWFLVTRAKILPSSLSHKTPHQNDESGKHQLEMAVKNDIFLHSLSAPSDFPPIQIVKSAHPAPGNLYMANIDYVNDLYGTYLMIVDEATNLLYYKSTWPKFAQDFKPQPGGKYSYFDATNYRFYIMDSTFTVVDSIEAANGYQTDSHEIRFLSDGNYVILALEEAKVDMSALVNGGDTAATVISDILQEFDHDKNLLFEWRTRDHFQVTDAAYENLLSPSIDFVHANSIELDHDTAYVLSCRNMDEVTKISRENGNIIWRWGGKHNQFTFVHDSLLFSHQHDVRILPNGNFTMFDNGNLHNTSTPASRAVEYSLDQESKIATKIWEYHHDPDIFGLAMGSTQRLTNGNTLICWGWCDSTAVTEVAPDGSTTFELRFPLGHYTYRAYKYTDAEIHAAVHNTESVTGSLELRQNFPNPVTGSTTISFHNSSQNQVTLTVFDALGREVKKLFNGIVDTGEYSEIFDSSPFPNGVYLTTLQVGGKTSSKRLIISR